MKNKDVAFFGKLLNKARKTKTTAEDRFELIKIALKVSGKCNELGLLSNNAILKYKELSIDELRIHFIQSEKIKDEIKVLIEDFKKILDKYDASKK